MQSLIHIGFILDGNRRWARANNRTIAQGHRKGYMNFRTVALASIKYGVKYVSGYVFSTENWKRDQQEVKDIMSILKWVLKYEVKKLHKDGIRVRVIGSKARLGAALLTAIHDAEKLTENNERGTILLCLDYGGHEEIVNAVKKIANMGTRPKDITVKMIEQNLYAPDIPPPDLIIRTSGEQRLSNFLTWQSAYSELLFSKKFWPDFSITDLKQSIKEFNNRQRRFGK